MTSFNFENERFLSLHVGFLLGGDVVELLDLLGVIVGDLGLGLLLLLRVLGHSDAGLLGAGDRLKELILSGLVAGGLLGRLCGLRRLSGLGIRRGGRGELRGHGRESEGGRRGCGDDSDELLAHIPLLRALLEMGRGQVFILSRWLGRREESVLILQFFSFV